MMQIYYDPWLHLLTELVPSAEIKAVRKRCRDQVACAEKSKNWWRNRAEREARQSTDHAAESVRRGKDFDELYQFAHKLQKENRRLGKLIQSKAETTNKQALRDRDAAIANNCQLGEQNERLRNQVAHLSKENHSFKKQLEQLETVLGAVRQTAPVKDPSSTLAYYKCLTTS